MARRVAHRTLSLLAVLAGALLAACQGETRDPTAPPAPQPESAVIRLERGAEPGVPDEILTVTGLGHVTWREVPSGDVARFRISVDQLLVLERAFDDAEFADLPATVWGRRCAECAAIVLTRGVGAGERSVILEGDPRGHPRAVREMVAGLDVLAARARANRAP